jgi:hypothetical protein
MKHFNKLLSESRKLTVFEMLKKLEVFLHEKYGIKSFGVKQDNGIILYMSKYVGEDGEGDISQHILEFVEKDYHLDNVKVHKSNYGYHITFGHNAEAAKLIEVTQADGSGIAGAKTTYICSFCDKEHKGYGNDPWPVMTQPGHRACDNCNSNIVIPARLEELFKKENVNEAINRGDVEKRASNIVLDNKFVWLFNVLDKNGRDLEEGIEYLQDAINLLIKDNAAFLVAFPYIDPKPGDQNVELVFADNPGPVVIYNNEEVTVPKTAKRPTTERPVKPNMPDLEDEKEEVVEEAANTFKESEKETMLIDTNLSGAKNKEILDAVIGQLSDGIWENSPAMKKYWQNIRIEEQDGRLYLKVKTYGNDRVLVYLDKTPEQLKIWYAKKIKEIIKREIEDYDENLGQWSRDNENVSAYLGYNEDITVADAYKAYETMLGRSTQGRYSEASQNQMLENKDYMSTYKISYKTEKNGEWKEIVTTTKTFEQYGKLNSLIEKLQKNSSSIVVTDMLDKEKIIFTWIAKENTNINFKENFNEVKENFYVTVDFTRAWYDLMDELEVGQEPYEAIKGQIVALEDYLADNNVFMSFDYAGQKQYDIISNVAKQEECIKAKDLLDEFLDNWATVAIIEDL